MTVEIKQLVIRAVVDAGREQAVALGSTTPVIVPGAATRVHTAEHAAALDEQREAIVAACVRGVLRKLERARQR